MRPYYANGNVTLFHGRAEEIVPHLAFDVVLTDPPYGIGLAYGDESVDTHAAFCRLTTWVVGLGVPTAMTLPSTKVFDIPRPQWLGVWHKPLTMGFFTTPLIPHWEAIAFYGMPAKGHRSDVWTKNPMKPNGHPAPKPLGLWCELLAIMPPGIVLDPYLGSGTTAVAARLLGRSCIGVEQSEAYCELAAMRLQQTVMPLPVEVGTAAALGLDVARDGARR